MGSGGLEPLSAAPPVACPPAGSCELNHAMPHGQLVLIRRPADAVLQHSGNAIVQMLPVVGAMLIWFSFFSVKIAILEILNSIYSILNSATSVLHVYGFIHPCFSPHGFVNAARLIIKGPTKRASALAVMVQFDHTMAASAGLCFTTAGGSQIYSNSHSICAAAVADSPWTTARSKLQMISNHVSSLRVPSGE